MNPPRIRTVEISTGDTHYGARVVVYHRESGRIRLYPRPRIVFDAAGQCHALPPTASELARLLRRARQLQDMVLERDRPLSESKEVHHETDETGR